MGIDMRMYRCDHSNELCADLYIHMSNPGLAKTSEVDLPPRHSRLAGSMPLLTSRLAGCTDLYNCKRRNKEIDSPLRVLHLLHLAKGRTPEGHK